MIPDEQVRLSHMAPGGGCAAKIGPGTLQGILEGLPRFEDANLLVGIETNDDGAVYRISDDLAMIQTLDFFPPMVDDPFLFGQIAAANALSDIYAMGGEPKVALNIVAWPNCVNPEILGRILAGGAEKVKEAGAVLAGGHSIQDDVPKYGLSVTGFVHPQRMYTNCGARPGDVLFLTKPLGTGLVNTAVKAGMASKEAEREVAQVMTELNRKAAECLRRFDVYACHRLWPGGPRGGDGRRQRRDPGAVLIPPAGTEGGGGVRQNGSGAGGQLPQPGVFAGPRPGAGGAGLGGGSAL